MDSTPVSLLERLRQPNQPLAWARLVELYTPPLMHWAVKKGIRHEDAADLVQDVFVTLVQKLPQFTYDRQRTFGGWLLKIRRNKWCDRLRRRGVPVDVEQDVRAVVAEPEPAWEAEYRQHLVRRALELMQREFEVSTWRACWEVVVEGRKPSDVAAELGISVNAVYVARWRVLARLRRELAGLVD